MTKFLVLYKCTAEGQQKMMNSAPEEHKKVMSAWFSWKDEAGDFLVDFGAPIGGKDSIGGEAFSEVIGYSIVEDEDLESAKTKLKDHPHVTIDPENCSIDVYECRNMPSM